MDYKRWSLIGLIAVFLLSFVAGAVYAAEEEADAEESWLVTIMPVRYGSVTGDTEKFKAINWMKDGYVGGIKELIYTREENDAFMRFEGHAIPEENDKEAILFYEKEDLGEMDIHYSMFRKYFDTTGGYYYPHSTLDVLDVDQDLDLDIGHLKIVVSPDLEDLHDITFLYERHTKEGKKSRLTWADAREGSERAYIVPSWQSVDEEVNIFALQGKTEVAGVNLEGEQRYEKVKAHNIRYEDFQRTGGSASGNKDRAHHLRPEAEILTTTFSGDNWFNNEKSYVNVAYRYNKIDNDELENIKEYDQNGNLFNFTRAHTIVNAMADNEVDDHIVIGHYSTELAKNLNVAAKFKGELMIRDGQSTYPADDEPEDAPPDGVIDSIQYNQTKNKVLNFGQDFSFRYTGIKNASIYGNVEVAQIHNDLEETQRDTLRNLDFERETDAKTKKTTWTLGARVIPSKFFNMTTQFRRRLQNTDYDNEVSTLFESAFFNSMKIISNELTTKLTWKPFDWVQGSFRYQLVDKKWETRVIDQDSQKTRMHSQIFTYDLSLHPLDNLFMNLAYVKEDVKTSTPGTSFSAFPLPGFKSDVNSILFSTSYIPNEVYSYTGSFVYSFSDNFDDFTSLSVPYGVDNSRKSLELGMSYSPKGKNWSLEPHYAFYSYNTGALSEFGNYNAHVGWVDLTMEW